MVKLETLNSRMKDFYDIWFLSQNLNFDGKIIKEAVFKTSKTRQTSMELQPICLSDKFALEKEAQWKAFINRDNLSDIPVSFEKVVSDIASFLLPIAEAVHNDQSFTKKWSKGGPWS